MPHFIIECSETVKDTISELDLLKEIHHVANASGLFEEADIKVRMNPYSTYLVGGEKKDFVHVFASVMGGRSTVQKAELSKAIVHKLKAIFPDIPFIAMNVDDFEKATYCNLRMLD